MSVKDPDDLSILNQISQILGSISNDRKKKIIQTIASFYDMGSGSVEGVSVTEVVSSEPTSSAFSENRTTSAKEFIMQKKPTTDIERVVCLAYYLAHYRGMDGFKTLDISKLNAEAAQLKFSNPTHAVDNASRAGYLVQTTRGQKKISAIGEVYVQKLPDRESAKMAVSHYRPRKSKQHKKG